MARTRRTACAIAVLGAVSFGGAGCSEPDPAPMPLPLVVTDDGGARLQAMVTATIVFVEQRCVGVEARDGRQYLGIFPPGSTVESDGDGWMLLIPGFAPFAPGDRIEGGGGMVTSEWFSAEDVPAECLLDGAIQVYPVAT